MIVIPQFTPNDINRYFSKNAIQPATDITSEFMDWVLYNGWWNDELSWDDTGDWIDEPQN
jgi:hypothetical protein